MTLDLVILAEQVALMTKMEGTVTETATRRIAAHDSAASGAEGADTKIVTRVSEEAAPDLAVQIV